jgi:hypothetical protein
VGLGTAICGEAATNKLSCSLTMPRPSCLYPPVLLSKHPLLILCCLFVAQITGLSKAVTPPSAFRGYRLCLTLGGACPTMATFCPGGNCATALFDTTLKCCPTMGVAASTGRRSTLQSGLAAGLASAGQA